MISHWQKSLLETWGISGDLSRLDGEYDLNFLVSGTPGHVLKVMRPGCDLAFVAMQCEAIRHIQQNVSDLPIPSVVANLSGQLFAVLKDHDGQERIAWLLEKVPGIPYARFRPQTINLAKKLGTILARMDKALVGFEHEYLARDFKWNLMQGEWISDQIHIVDQPDRCELLNRIYQQFTAILPALQALPHTAIHNDVNDYNFLVSGNLTEEAQISGLIDFGDMCRAPRVCELAIAGAYLVLDHDNPEEMLSTLVAAYHAVSPLSALEIDLVWPLLKMRLAVSLVNSTQMAIENPDDPYVVISQKPAWRFLEGNRINEAMIGARLRVACNMPVTARAERIMHWLNSESGNFAPIFGQDLVDAPMGSCAVEYSTIPADPFAITAEEAATLGAEYGVDGPVWLGYYKEPRLIYTEKFFQLGPWKASDRRTVHLGIDIFGPVGSSLYAPLDGEIVFCGYRPNNLDYGGLVILSHQTPQGDIFHTLYGHLSKASVEKLTVGQRITKGCVFANLGALDENGGWNPHVHFQLALTIVGMEDDWPGTCVPDQLDFWSAVFPNPASLLNLPEKKVEFIPVSRKDTLEARQKNFGRNLKLSYCAPVMFLRGWKHHLFDEWGHPYLDAYNNVPHVGHAHPRIQAVVANQLKRLNSNTRYLHPAQNAFAEKICSKLPDSLSVCFFVNSGTEANELALRLSRAHSGGKDMITPDHGYHGNTTGAIDISAYKFNAKGGVGQADWVQLVEVADEYRGSYRRGDPARAEKYASLVDGALENISARGGRLAGFIAETFPSVGGQIIPPAGYLQSVYRRIRAAGGICIADEVQTGLGRLGDYYFGFEQQEVVPDIVVLGKPIGNGHPLGVVVTTREIADSFAQGPEYFSTFGGSTLSCLIGKEVLDIVDEENLMENARVMGNKLLAGLRAMQEEFDIIGDVRGFGLFIGVDLVTDCTSRTSGTQIADYVKNRMRENRILIGSEGPADNILKIRPPLTIDEEGVNMILHTLHMVVSEATGLRS